MLVASSSHHNHHHGNGMGCNISVTLSDGQFLENMNESNQPSPNVSPKKTSFLDSLIRRSSSSDNDNNNKKEKKSPTQSSWPNIFTRNKQSTEIKKAQEADEDMAKLIVEMELEGRSEAEIRMHLSYIHDVRTAPTPPAAPASPTRAPPKANVITQFFRDVQQAFREEVLLINPYPEYEYDDVSGLTISISSAPFFGAPPPDMDMTYEELANLEPVYVGSTSINNLPTCKHDGTPLPGDQTKCPVCLCEFSEGEDLKSLPCVHFFHKECIDRWLMVGHSCPMCKTLVE